MAKIVENMLVIKFSSIVKDADADQRSCVTEEVRIALEQVAQELVGQGIVVEAEQVQ